MLSFIKKIAIFLVVIIFFYVFYRGFTYYRENKAYAHYVIKSLGNQYKSPLVDGYTDRTSYSKDEKQNVFLNPRKIGTQWVRLFTVNGKVVDSIKTHLHFQKSGSDPSVNGYRYSKNFSFPLDDLKSGLYLWEHVVPFIVKDTGAITVVYPTNTINAYNISGGKSLYKIFTQQSSIISFQRPTFPAVSFHTNSMMKYLDQLKGYNFSYITDQDMDKSNWLAKTKLLIVIGHSEYWTRKARENFDRFVAGGGNTLVLSGNTMWWQVRYSEDGTQLICYKNLPDPVYNTDLQTTNWNATDLRYPIYKSIGADFIMGGYGVKSPDNMGGLKILHPEHPIFKGCDIKEGEVLNIPTKEYDGTFLKKSGIEPEIDKSSLGFYKAQLLGYDFTINEYTEDGMGSFIIFQKTPQSGTVINVGTADWCSGNGIGGPDSIRVQKITLNMIDALYNAKDLFTN